MEVEATKASFNAAIRYEFFAWAGVVYGESADPNTSGYRAHSQVINYSNSDQLNAPTGELAAANVQFKWNGSAWAVCRDSGVQYSWFSTWSWWIMTEQGTPPCGYGWYQTRAGGWGWNGIAGQWQGGFVDTPGQFFANPGALMAGPPVPPPADAPLPEVQWELREPGPSRAADLPAGFTAGGGGPPKS